MKVIKNYIYNASYQLLVVLLPLITTPYVTRVLTSSGYGVYTYTFTNIQYFVLLAGMGVAIYGNREVAYYATNENKDKLSNIFWEIVIIKMFSSGVAFVAFFFLLFASNMRFKLLMGIQSINILSVVFDISWFYMGLEQFKVTVFKNTVVKILSIILIFLLVKSKSDIYLYTFIMGGSLLFGNLTLWPQLKGRVNLPKIEELHPFRHLRPSLLLLLPQVALQLYMQINKTLLGIMVSPTASGFYYSSDTIIKVILSIATATGTVMLPHATKAFSEGKIDKVKSMLYESFDFVSLISFPMAFGLAAISLKMAPWFLGSAYKPVGVVMMIESMVIILNAWGNAVGEQYLLPVKKTKEYTESIIAGAMANIIVIFPLIKIGGLNGAMVGYCFSETIVFSYQLVKIRKEIVIKRLFRNSGKYLLGSLVMFFVVFYINKKMNMSLISLFLQVCIGLFIYLLMIFIEKPSILNNLYNPGL